MPRARSGSAEAYSRPVRRVNRVAAVRRTLSAPKNLP